jgi:hypothetical protein
MKTPKCHTFWVPDPCECEGPLWAADDAEAVLKERAISQVMQDIHHVVMTTDKGVKNPSRVRDVELDCSDKVRPTLPVGSRHQMVAREDHRDRAPREIVDGIFAPDEKVAD